MRAASWETIAAIVVVAVIAIITAVVFVLREVGRRRKTEERLHSAYQTLEETWDLVLITDRKGKIEYINKAGEELTGYGREELIGKRGGTWLPWRDDGKLLKEIQDALRSGEPFRASAVGAKKSGETFQANVAVHPVKEDRGIVTQIIFTARDITRQKKLEDRLHYLARYDVLTGMPNRTFFAHLLKQQIARSTQEKRFLSVMILDIDRFKYVNDVFGFETGDEVLKRTAEKLRATVEKGDIVARLGSDEFGVVHIDQVQPVDAASVVARILDAVLDTVPIEGRELALTMSAGIAVHGQDGEDAQTLIQNADIALAKAKSLGRNNVQFYSQDINARASEFVFMEKRLFNALKNDEYLIHYQPYHQLTTSKVAGAEALIKWRNTDLGLVSPSRFIPTLEDTGMIIDVGEWVLKTACRQMKEWGKGKYPHPLSVNLSMIQLRHKYLLNMVSDSLSEFKLSPERLTLEVTEGIFMHDMEFSTSVLKRLKDIGVSISIDDFGTGYSSLSYLKRLPVDNVKIDISFVRDITKDPDAASMVTAITGMARSLNLKTIAEGVETEEQLNVLRLLRCDMGQGYYFSPALPPADFAQYLSGPDEPSQSGPAPWKAAPTKTKTTTAAKTKSSRSR